MIADHQDIKNGSIYPHSTVAKDIVLSDHVRSAVSLYFKQLNGTPIFDLHNLVMAEVEKPLLQVVLEHYGHNQSKAAHALGISRSTLRKKMLQYNLG